MLQILQKFIVIHIVKTFTFPASVESKGSIPCSQEPAITPYPEPVKSNSHIHNLCLQDPLQCYPFLYT